MIKSMTGFGEAEYSDGSIQIDVEIKSLNHRYKDINVRMSKELSSFEEKIIKVIKKEIKRGRVDTYINIKYIKEGSSEVIPNIELAKNYKKAISYISKRLEIEEDISISDILKFSDIIEVKRKDFDKDELWKPLKETLEKALGQLLHMRSVEGNNLKVDIKENLNSIEKDIKRIKERSGPVIREYKKKFQDRIQDLLVNNYEIEEEISLEAAIFTEKTNIDEEITRLKSHINQLVSILEEGGPVGRKIDFLVQEINREINTIGSKSSDYKISN